MIPTEPLELNLPEIDPQTARETHQSLMVYATIIRAGEPLTVRQLMRATGLPDGTLYPILQKRVKAGLMIVDESGDAGTYDFTVAGYERARLCLTQLEVSVVSWLHTDRRFA